MDTSRRRILLVVVPTTFLLLFAHHFRDNDVIRIDTWIRRLSTSQSLDPTPAFKSILSRLVRGRDQENLESTGFACDTTPSSVVCVSNLPSKIDTRGNVTVYLSSDRVEEKTNIVRPYARQQDKYGLLQYVTAVNILDKKKRVDPPVCQHNHTTPAVIFSSGLTGNLFHEFNDILVPLFITTRLFDSRVLLLLEDYNPWFVKKYDKILSRLSDSEVMNPKSNESVHCFPDGFAVGLKYHDNLAVNETELPGGLSMLDFRAFLREAYRLKHSRVSQIRKPRLLLISREKTRKFLNEDEIVAMMREVGFAVVIARGGVAMNLTGFSHTVNSCSVIVGAHGAGLTNAVFLPEGAVMVQVEPLGLDWVSANYFGIPAKGMGLRYLRYKIEPEESSLLEAYGYNHTVIKDPAKIHAMGYKEARRVYIDEQDIRVHVARFRATIVEALKIVVGKRQESYML